MSLSTAATFAVANWTLNETSGSRADSVGSTTLTDNGTVGSAVGKLGNAADFGTGSSTKYLTAADNAAISTGDVDFTVRAWVYLSAKTKSYPAVIGKVSADGGTIEYQLLYRASQAAFEWGFGGATVRATTFGDPSTGTWYLLHAWHDATGNVVGISVNAGTADTAADAGGTDTTKGFAIGTMGEYHDASSTWDGLIDDVVMLKGYVMTAQDRTDDYNGGTGLAFSSWSGGGGTSVPAGSLALLGVGM